jgi:hypothetical protein
MSGTAARHGEHRDTGRVHIVLETPRLVMRQFTKDDVDNLFDLSSEPHDADARDSLPHSVCGVALVGGVG